jgi:hypothetical protein
MCSSNLEPRALAWLATLALGGVACSTPAAMFARAAAAERERRAAESYVYASAVAPGTVPLWAIHVARPELDETATLEALEARLTGELAEDELPELFVPPEQLGALAVRELQQGHVFDAAILLALASHRRFQQAEVAYAHGMRHGLRTARQHFDYRSGLNEAAYREYVEHEAQVFRDARFDEEIERISAKQGLAIDERSVADDLMRLVMGNISDPDAASRAIKQREAVMATPAAEKLFHPELASSLHRYLVARARLEDGPEQRARASVAYRYLARVPLRAFRFSALQTVNRPFDGLVIRAGVSLYGQEPARLAELLRSVRGETRAHVAIILGLSGDITRIRELQQSYDLEPDRRVRLALAFALLRLGEHQHLTTLQAGLRDPDPKVIEYATVLVRWLPHDLELEFSEELLADVATNESLETGARWLAASVLCELGARRPLSEESLRRVLNVAREVRDNHEQLELVSRTFATLQQLDRTRVLAELRKKGALVEPWLARLAEVALPADLPFLDALMRNHAFREHRLQLLHIAAVIPGARAQTLIQRWFADYRSLRTSILLRLIMRKDLDKQRLRELTSVVGGAHQFMFALASGEGKLRDAAKYASSDDAEERHIGMLALRLFGGAVYREVLWPNASFHDARYYPAEVRLRQLALATLVDLELNRSDLPRAGQPAAEGLALEMISPLIGERIAPPAPRLPDPPSELRLRPPAEVEADPRSLQLIRASGFKGKRLQLAPP